ncbi:transglycosylase SLT domain-containing protein [Magnetospira sp. QH-2]|uniref:transglycosylase SLT domain-containing protein n=1 Tax=Magnetospira sp. (strain QH-2) TaxID=1288970 RepID=UPI0003E81BB4|nr:transglycosylase SLT domain-containing protein [Magnetospira sp. QH-2]CCQ73197.1 Putative GH23 : soluble lytic murein transglycosylase and related regulatory protein [Magnetospira sp. QH-2]
MRPVFAFGLMFASLWLPDSAQASPAAKAGLNGDDWGLCSRYTAAQERLDGIPQHLLTAISVVETGRSGQNGRAITAWPWTINAEGKGYYLPSKASAVAKVEELRAQGMKSIDVGCMQVNLMYHDDAFTDLQRAFDPKTNVAYAAAFLSRLQVRTKSWVEAAGQYHSTRRVKGTNYRTKVMEAWTDLHEQQGGADETVVAGAKPKTKPATIDPLRLVDLNRSFKLKRMAAKPEKGAAKRGQQLDDWRSMRDKQPFTVLAAVQMARNKQSLRAAIGRETKIQKANHFEQRRRKQLTKWRIGNGYE